MTNAELIYSQIESENTILSLFNSFETECLFFDFKEMRVAPNDDFRKLFGKSISGFSNADGGVLILGVKDNGNATPRFELSPSEHYQSYNLRVQEQISRLTEPPNAKIISKVIQSENFPEKGYTIILIPKSEIAPHQDVITRKYYQRAGDSHKEMYHFQIADLFGRRVRPQIRVVGALKYDPGHENSVTIELFVENFGKGIARFPFIQITEIGHFNKNRYYTSWFLDPIKSQSVDIYSSTSDHVIQSEVRRNVMQYYAPLRYFPDEQFTEIRGRIGCDEISTRPFVIKITSQDAHSVYRNRDTIKEFCD